MYAKCSINTYSAVDEKNAQNELHIASDNTILYTNIYYNTNYMGAKGFSYDMKLNIALHEMGHTFGLSDIGYKGCSENDTIQEYSVMYYATMSKYFFTDYTEFDKHNIDWYYKD